MFIETLFTIAKIWKQPKCLSTNEWINKMRYLYTRILFSHKKNEILPFATTWMDLEGIMVSEISQRMTNTLYYHLYVDSKKIKQMNVYNKTETDSQI